MMFMMSGSDDEKVSDSTAVACEVSLCKDQRADLEGPELQNIVLEEPTAINLQTESLADNDENVELVNYSDGAKSQDEEAVDERQDKATEELSHSNARSESPQSLAKDSSQNNVSYKLQYSYTI